MNLFLVMKQSWVNVPGYGFYLLDIIIFPWIPVAWPLKFYVIQWIIDDGRDKQVHDPVTQKLANSVHDFHRGLIGSPCLSYWGLSRLRPMIT